MRIKILGPGCARCRQAAFSGQFRAAAEAVPAGRRDLHAGRGRGRVRPECRRQRRDGDPQLERSVARAGTRGRHRPKLQAPIRARKHS